jgi:hypothetical protein
MTEEEGGDKDAEMRDARESVEDVGETTILELRGLWLGEKPPPLLRLRG